MLNPVRWLTFRGVLVSLSVGHGQGQRGCGVPRYHRADQPGHREIRPNLKTDMALTILATSITLTPGTLSVEIDEDSNELYVHWINVAPEVLKEMPRDYHPICGTFPDWARRIAE
jgi:multicomponent Na+:H+ antiporter subunit E